MSKAGGQSSLSLGQGGEKKGEEGEEEGKEEGRVENARMAFFIFFIVYFLCEYLKRWKKNKPIQISAHGLFIPDLYQIYSMSNNRKRKYSLFSIPFLKPTKLL